MFFEQNQLMGGLSILELLKVHTQEVHKSLEAGSFMSNFLKDDLNMTRYQELLRTIFQVLAPIERAIAESSYLTNFQSVKSRDYFTALKEDLSYFGQLDLLSSHPLPGPEITSLAQLAGVLYVLEGSALGGRVLEKKIKHKLTIDKNSGLAYFSAQSELGFNRWPMFKDEIESLVKENEFQSCLDSAKLTFGRFKC